MHIVLLIVMVVYLVLVWLHCTLDELANYWVKKPTNPKKDWDLEVLKKIELAREIISWILFWPIRGIFQILLAVKKKCWARGK